MGTITPRKRSDGTVGYTAQIRIRRDGKIAHNETHTFDRKQAATAWLKKRESELGAPGGLDRARRDDPTLAAVIERYIAESERKIGRTKTQVLRAIKSNELAALPCSKVTSAEIVTFSQNLGVQPQTVSNYLSHLSSIFAVARPAWGYPLDQQAMRDAFAVTKRLGLTGKSKQRERRPTLDELDRVMRHFADRQRRRPGSAPMQWIIVFAIFSTRRLEEILRVMWRDLDEEHARVMVRDMKNPGEKIGNDIWCDLPPEALRIAKVMPRIAEQIFPFGADAVGMAFTRAMQFLAIEDLHFHDLRHEGVSRLFELGRTIPQVAGVSGHRSWQSLQRYTHVRQTGDKFAGWPWLDVLSSTTPPGDAHG